MKKIDFKEFGTLEIITGILSSVLGAVATWAINLIMDKRKQRTTIVTSAKIDKNSVFSDGINPKDTIKAFYSSLVLGLGIFAFAMCTVTGVVKALSNLKFFLIFLTFFFSAMLLVNACMAFHEALAYKSEFKLNSHSEQEAR